MSLTYSVYTMNSEKKNKASSFQKAYQLHYIIVPKKVHNEINFHWGINE